MLAMANATHRAHLVVERFPNGNKVSEITMSAGVRHGAYRLWHENGTLMEQGRYRKGQLHGIIQKWNDEGRLLGTYRVVDGAGIVREWHSNGQLSYEMSFVRGVMNGRMRWWDADGMFHGQRYYFDGSPISKKKYLEKCKSRPELPRFEDENITNTLGNYIRRLRRSRREQVESGPTPEDLKQKKWFDDQCKSRAKRKNSRELMAWLTNAGRGQKELGEMTKNHALKLARKLYQLGAGKIWAVDVERDEDGAEYSKRLIIHLPKEPAKRGEIYELCADSARPLSGGTGPAIKFGMEFMRVSMM